MSAPAAPTPDTSIQLSWVLPLFRTAAQLEELVARIARVSTRLGLAYEVILVDDACPEGSGAIAQAMAAHDATLRVLRLPANGGQDPALRAGLRLARGEWTVILDADLQDPPEALERLWPHRAGMDAVFTRRTGRYTTPGRHLTSRLYRSAIEVVGRLPRGACLYVLLGRALVERINAAQGRRTTLLALIASHRPRCTSVRIVRAPRAVGGSAYSAAARARRAARSLWEMFAACHLRRAL
jgi:glycosyltransferase involved in cell wall biosynthesis